MVKYNFNLDNSYVELPDIFYAKQEPSKVPSARIVVLNYSLIKELELDADYFESNYGVDILVGNKLPKGSIPIAQAYAGHQFGYFTMLGDGRAILIGEYVNKNGERVDVQLKGAGVTPYSRGGDGKATLGPMLREYIISESMNALGIPTTRSLAVVETGESIIREKILPGAVLTRVASSHIRVGTFQFVAKWGNFDELKALADYAIERHYKDRVSEETKYLDFLKEVIRRQAELIAKWQLVGFLHGVMNTDNMTISGETIDYGPCAFMDIYNTDTVFSSIDSNGRYAYGNQPNIGAWNLARLAETLLPLLHDNSEEAIELAQESISDFSKIYKEKWTSGMRKKLGLFNEELEDEYLIEGLLSTMQKYGSDYTNTFRGLTLDKIRDIDIAEKEEFIKWYELWQQRLLRQNQSREEAKELMKKNNPSVIPRNYRVEEALDKAVKEGDYSVMDKLLSVLSKPYDYSDDNKDYVITPKLSDTPYRTFCGI